MKKALLVSAFPGTGKSEFFRLSEESDELTVLDSDSSTFDKEGFPENYIEHIKSYLETSDVICISSDKEVRDSLMNNNLKYTLVFPLKETKGEYLKRYEERGDTEEFIQTLDENWDLWLEECKSQGGCDRVELDSTTFISDIIPGLLEGQ